MTQVNRQHLRKKENIIVSQPNQEEPLMGNSTKHNDMDSLDPSMMEEPNNAMKTMTYTHSGHSIKPTMCTGERTQQ